MSKLMVLSENGYNEIRSRIKYNIILNNGYELNDLVHDTILKLSKCCKTESDLIQQSIKTAKNILIDYHRKVKKRKFVSLNYIPENIHQDQELEIKIPPKYKELFILRYKFYMKIREISEFTDTKINTIKGRVVKMNKAIKELNHFD